MNRLLHPAEVVLAGPPNAGKSTLANALVGRPVSIVHETPGTTRDWVRELALLGGLPVWITDTAGIGRDDAIRSSTGVSPVCTTGILPVGGEGSPPVGVPPARVAGVSPMCTTGILPVVDGLTSQIEHQAATRARQRLAGADTVLLLSQSEESTPDWLAGKTVLRIRPKADIRPPPSPCESLAVSARTGEGMDRLRLAILGALGLADFDPAVPRAFTQRQASLLTAAAEAIDHADAANASEALRRLLGQATSG